MNNRTGDIDTLFQRMAATPTIGADQSLAVDAAKAVEEWPLLAMLTHAAPPPARSVHHMMMPVEDPLPMTAPEPVTAAPLEPVPVFEAEPGLAPVSASSNLSTLEQLFQRAELTGKPQSFQPTVFVASEPPAAIAPVERERPSAPLMAPPPLKVPSQSRTAPLSRPAAAQTTRTVRNAESVVAVEPQVRKWRPLETVPEQLFERVGGR